jgi:hypothetical protein
MYTGKYNAGLVCRPNWDLTGWSRFHGRFLIDIKHADEGYALVVLHNSLFPSAVTMSSNNDADGSPHHYQHILDAALAKYLEDTGRDLVRDQVAVEIQGYETLNGILEVVKRHAEAFDEFTKGDSRLMKYLDPIVNGLHVLFSNKILSDGVSQVCRMKVFRSR